MGKTAGPCRYKHIKKESQTGKIGITLLKRREKNCLEGDIKGEGFDGGERTINCPISQC